MPTNFTSPTGRIVQGDVFEPQTTDQQGKPRVILNGPKAGQPNPQWFIAVAFAKNDPAWPPFKAILDAEAAASWPSLHPGGVRIPNLAFSDKIIDGDGYDTTGKHNATKEGFAGHWIVRFTSGFAPKAWRETAPGSRTYTEITNPAEIKRGYFVRVNGSTVTNQNPTKPGIHVNLGMVELVGVGVEIISGPSAAEAFAAPAALPAGATALPPAGAAPGGAPPPAPPPPAAPPPAAPPPPPPAAAAPPPPYTGYMPGAAPARVMLPAANGATYEALTAQGWTDELLVQHQMMAPAAAAPPPAAPPPAAAPPPPPPAPPPAAPPPAAPVGRMTAKAAGQTREAMLATGWTDLLLVQHGYMEDYVPH